VKKLMFLALIACFLLPACGKKRKTRFFITEREVTAIQKVNSVTFIPPVGSQVRIVAKNEQVIEGEITKLEPDRLFILDDLDETEKFILYEDIASLELIAYPEPDPLPEDPPDTEKDPCSACGEDCNCGKYCACEEDDCAFPDNLIHLIWHKKAKRLLKKCKFIRIGKLVIIKCILK
jgi:hypothetical protein